LPSEDEHQRNTIVEDTTFSQDTVCYNVWGEFPEMDFVEHDFIGMMQFIEAREEGQCGDNGQGNSSRVTLSICYWRASTRILWLTCGYRDRNEIEYLVLTLQFEFIFRRVWSRRFPFRFTWTWSKLRVTHPPPVDGKLEKVTDKYRFDK